jgi:hypothetical protein
VALSHEGEWHGINDLQPRFVVPPALEELRGWSCTRCIADRWCTRTNARVQRRQETFRTLLWSNEKGPARPRAL